VKNDTRDVVFGLRPVLEALQSGKEIEKIYLHREAKNPVISELVSLASDLKVPILKVPIEKLNKITRKAHQGVICYVSPITYASLDNVVSDTFGQGKVPLLLILDRITDVRNFGAISRTAECLGVNAIVIPSRGSAEINSDAVKTSAGALNYIPIVREDNLKNTLTYLKDSGFQIVACSEKAEKMIYQADFTPPIAIIMGSEEDGVSPEYLRKTDMIVKIPQVGNIESLNVSVATGVILSEVVRQRL
jgi:23S rRNA (guanosine2251-2'-O)-methyltransferase